MSCSSTFGGGEYRVGMFIFILAQLEVFLSPLTFAPSPNRPRKSRSHPNTKHQAIQLRKESTPAETKFWSQIRNNQLDVSFRRQHAVGQYISDFPWHAFGSDTVRHDLTHLHRTHTCPGCMCQGVRCDTLFVLLLDLLQYPFEHFIRRLLSSS